MSGRNQIHSSANKCRDNQRVSKDDHGRYDLSNPAQNIRRSSLFRNIGCPATISKSEGRMNCGTRLIIIQTPNIERRSFFAVLK